MSITIPAFLIKLTQQRKSGWMIHTFDGNRYYYRKINNSINLRAVLRKMKTLFKHQNHKSNVWKFKIRVAMEFFFNDRSSPLSAFLLFSMKRNLVFIQLKFRRLRILLVPECATTGGYLQGRFITDFKNRYFYVFNGINIMSMTRPSFSMISQQRWSSVILVIF